MTPTTACAIRESFELLNQLRVLFLHHSVGDNLLEGLQRLAVEVSSAPPRMIDLQASQSLDGPALLHTRGGSNKQPESKIDAFAQTLRDLEAPVDVALMKLCFVDIDPHTRVHGLMDRYCSAIQALQLEHAETYFLHMTVPLMSQPCSWKDRAKRVIRRLVWEDEANAKRDEFNRRLLTTFGAENVFDIATLESTHGDGRKCAFRLRGELYPCLAPEWTHDGGHLNEAGSRRMASEWVPMLGTFAHRGASRKVAS